FGIIFLFLKYVYFCSLSLPIFTFDLCFCLYLLLLCLKQAIQKGNKQALRIRAENTIHQKKQAIDFLRVSARVDAVAARVQNAVTMGRTSALMNKFEHQFEILDIQTQQMEDKMSNSTTLTTPQVSIASLLRITF
uniref:Charged multivesicular body protein 1b n=1 Tax=Macaca fascicularis TaxID=9541 RepID=A0A7N9CEC0_MACFA